MNRLHSLFLKLYSAAVVSCEPVADPEFSEEEWTDLFHLAFEQEILSLMYDNCFSYDSFKRVPTESRRLWKDFALSSAIRQITQTNEFLTLILHAQEQGLDPVVLKGVICRDLYTQPFLRPSVDEDILIPADSTAAYHQFLLSEGLFADSLPTDTSQEMDSMALQAWLDSVAEISYHKEDSPTYIELHKTLFDPDSDIFGDLNALFEGALDRTVRVQIEDVSVRTLAPTDHLIYLFLHAFKHFVHSGIGIRAVCDIGIFAEHYAAEIDWEHISTSLENVRAFDFARALLRIVQLHLLPEARYYEMLSDWSIEDIDADPLLEDILASGVHGNSSLERLHSSNITLNAIAQDRKTALSTDSIQSANNDSKKSLSRSFSGLSVVFHSVFLPLDKMSSRFTYLRKAPILLPVAWMQRIFGYLKENALSRRIISLNTQSTSQTSVSSVNTSKSTTSKISPAESIRLGRSRVELFKLYGIIH